MRVLPILLAGCLLVATFTHIPTVSCLKSSDAKDADQVLAGGAESEVADQDEPEAAFDEKDVVVLTKANFDEAIKSHNYSLVEFYAPWCGHCKTLAPHYAKAATSLKLHDPSILMAKVDATEHSELSTRFGVEGFPTMKWFVGGEVLEYNGGRVEEDIIQWVKKKTGPPAKTISTVEELKTATASSSPVVVAYFSAFEGAAHTDFEDVARAVDKVEFVQTSDVKVAKQAGADKGIALYREFEGDKEVVHFDGKSDKDALKAWVKSEQLPPYIEFKEENQDAIFDSGIPLSALVVLKREDMAKGSKVTTAVKAAAAATKGKMVWVLVDTVGEAYEQISEFFGIKAADTIPKAVAFNMESSRQYAMEKGPITDASLTAFAKGVVDGTIKPQLKSDEVPTGDEAKEEGVTVVVGKNFEDVVKSSKHDVLLEAYAPWCGHCQKLGPTYVKLAKRFKKTSSIVIAKVDGTTNEHEDFKAEGYPTIWMWPAGVDRPVLYEGERSLKELTAFVRANAKKPITLEQTDAEMDAEDLKDQADAATRGQDDGGGADEDSDEEESSADSDEGDGAEEEAAEEVAATLAEAEGTDVDAMKEDASQDGDHEEL